MKRPERETASYRAIDTSSLIGANLRTRIQYQRPGPNPAKQHQFPTGTPKRPCVYGFQVKAYSLSCRSYGRSAMQLTSAPTTSSHSASPENCTPNSLPNFRNMNFNSGSSGTRVLGDNYHYAEEMEQQIAQFHDTETGLIVLSGFDVSGDLVCGSKTRQGYCI